VERALKLVHAVAVAEDGLSLTRAAQAVSLPTSTTARLLKSLEATGFATRDEHGVYRPGVQVLQIGAIAVSRLTLDAVAQSHLQDLAEVTGETAYLALPDGTERAVYLRQVESPRAIRHATWTGRTIATAGTAVGAALALRVNEHGYVTSRATVIEPDAAAAASPIVDGDGKAVAAISIIGPSFRLSDELLSEYGPEVARHAREISETIRLGR
jgi:DNA-binding IclR family transcriptional regulator